MAHAHKNGLIHGALDLSKILVQRINDAKLQNLLMKQTNRAAAPKVRKKPTRKASTTFVDDEILGHDCSADKEQFVNFFITDFQPYQSIKMMKKFDEDAQYCKIL